MLQEKIEQARRETRRSRWRVTLILVNVALTLLLLVAAVILVDFTRLGLTPGPSVVVESSVSEATPVAPPADVSSAVGSATEAAARTRFKEALAAFEHDVEPRISELAFAQWDAGLYADLPTRKVVIVAQFSGSDYGGAVQALDALANEARVALAARDAAFAGALTAASTAADGDDYYTASDSIAVALRLQPENADAQALAARIAALPPILNLIRRASVARTENDPNNEATLLTEALAADPSRSALAERLAAVQGEIAERCFNGHVANAMAALDRRDLATARRAFAAAKAMFAGRDETKLLDRRVATLAQDIEIARLTGKTEAAARADDWTAAQTHYEALAKILPADKQILAGLALARSINELGTRIARHLAAPQRLAAPNVAAEAKTLLADAAASAALSPGLARQRTALADAMAAYTTKVTVRVVSDGATAILVRGVGQVGVTTGRDIELLPGRYTFEGARPGFKSKHVFVEIAPGTSGLVVEITCDEPV